MISQAGIYSERADLLGRLRETVPAWTFPESGEARDACRIAIIDGGGRPPGKSIARIILTEEGDVALPDTPRRNGELVVPVTAFLATPGPYLAFAADLVEAVLHAAQLEQEAAYLRQIHELMTFVDAEAVSERITTTVLELIGLPYGTLFLHDPRLERYVVSYSNDPGYQESNEFLPGIPPDVLQAALASPQLFAESRGPGGGGMLVMPLQVREDLLGV